jgi:drug/metabolite transporter (DMT)-like permease
MKTRKGILGALAGVAASSIWGGMYVVSAVVLEVIPPFTLLALRLLVAIPVSALALRMAADWPHPTRTQALQLLGIGMVGYGFSLGAQFVGTRLSTAANGALVTSTTPAFVALFAALLLDEPLTGRRLASLASATLGVVVVINPAQADLSQDTLWGNVALLLAGVTWALYSVLAKWASVENATLTVTVGAMLGGVLLVGPLVPFELARMPVGEITSGIGLGVLYLGIIATAVATYLWTKCFELLDAGVAGLTFFAQSVVGALLSVLLLGEQLSVGFFVGGALILLGVALVSLPGRVREVAHANTAS